MKPELNYSNNQQVQKSFQLVFHRVESTTANKKVYPIKQKKEKTSQLTNQ